MTGVPDDSLRSKILADIVSGRYAPGELLPSSKELRHEYGCSYGALQHALANLVREEVLLRQQRRYRLFSSALKKTDSFICVVRARNAVSSLPVRHLGILRDLQRAATEHSLDVAHCGVFDLAGSLCDQAQALRGFVRQQERRGCLGYLLWLPAAAKAEEVSAMLPMLLDTGKPVCFLEDCGVRSLDEIVAMHKRYPRFRWFPFGYTPDAGLRMGQFLFSLGHRKVAWFAWPADTEAAIKRRSGLIDAFDALGLREAVVTVNWEESRRRPTVGPVKLNSEELSRVLRPAFEHALALDASAWVGFNDAVALEAARFLTERNVKVGRDISYAGFCFKKKKKVAGLSSYCFNEARLVNAILGHVITNPPHLVRRAKPTIEIPGFVVPRNSTCPPVTDAL